MEDASHQAHGGTPSLGSANEEQWRNLRRQIELADGFWLGFIFSSSLHTVAAFRRRVERILNFRVQRMHMIRPGSPDELRSALHPVFEPESAQADCVWVESIHSDPPVQGKDGKEHWMLAWDQFLLRANEHRDAARRRLSGSLILAAPPQVKPRARDAAPDLWSIRSLVLDLAPSSISPRGQFDRDILEARRTPGYTGSRPSDVPLDDDFAAVEVERICRRIEENSEYRPEGLIRTLGRAVHGYLDQGKAGKGVELAGKVIELLRERPNVNGPLAQALMWSSEAARADGDIAMAVEQVEEAVGLRRSILTSDRETPQVLRDLAISLDRVGEVRSEAGDLDAASIAFEEARTLRRRLLDIYGETSPGAEPIDG